MTLPHHLAWTEDPFGSRSWRERLHMLRFLNALLLRWEATEREVYRERAAELLTSWIAANPRTGAISPNAWGDMSTAWRTITLVCLTRMLPDTPWLETAITLHGQTLADPRFYVKAGNHALNQAIGLFDAGCHQGNRAWMDLGADRIGALIQPSVSTQGVSNEQAIRYDLYVYQRYMVARDHLVACGYPSPAAFKRVARIPRFLAHATRPDGWYETIGDTPDRKAAAIKGTPAEYAATRGTRGPRPTDEVMVFERGYVFGRTGWGERRPPRDETFLSLQFGSGKRFHGHDDGSALTLYAHRTQLLVDSGSKDYMPDAWRRYVLSREAHNTVVTKSLKSSTAQPTALERSVITDRSADFIVRPTTYRGVTIRRRVVFSRRLGYLVVEDTVRSPSTRQWRQLWHLVEGSRPVTDGLRTWTRQDGGNVLIQQLVGGGTTHILTGRTAPIQGWIARDGKRMVAAPVVERRTKGKVVRFVTVLVPFEGGDVPEVTDVSLTKRGFRLTVRVGDGVERVHATASTSRITTVP